MSGDLTLPRILCLHGAGTNAEIFHIQCRVIIARLKNKFRLVFANGFMEDDADDAVLSVFSEFAPFKRWISWREKHEPLDPVAASQSIVKQLTDAMEGDNGTGEWVGLLGFSQGGLISSSLLWAQDHIADESKRPLPGINFRFGVIMAAPGPVVLIDRTGTVPKPRHVASAGEIMSKFTDFPEDNQEDETHLVTTPTLHVHGLRDHGLREHRKLYKYYSKKEATTLMEWDGDHRVPIKSEDAGRLVNGIIQLAERAGMEFSPYDDDDW